MSCLLGQSVTTMPGEYEWQNWQNILFQAFPVELKSQSLKLIEPY